MLLAWTLIALSALAQAGCQNATLIAPNTLTSPYDIARGEVLWAVAPLTNESGVTLLDSAAISDAVILASQQIEGVRCLPLNRVIAEMRALNMPVVRSPLEAAALSERLGVNGLIVGTITDYDPYDPPRLGLSLVLETAGNLASPTTQDFGLDQLRGRTSGSPGVGGAMARYEEQPSASASVDTPPFSHPNRAPCWSLAPILVWVGEGSKPLRELMRLSAADVARVCVRQQRGAT